MSRAGSDRLPAGLTPSEAAAHWLVRIDMGPLAQHEQAQFDAWRAASSINADAFDKAEQEWALFDIAEGDPHLDALRASALVVGREPRRWIWFGIGGAIAASVAALVMLGGDLVPVGLRPADRASSAPTVATRPAAGATLPSRGDFVTVRGERRTVKLADGSAITLNTDSAIRVAYSEGTRSITLLRGQALFEVAKNKARPFVVHAGDRQVTALGTVFQIRLDSDRMKVMLVEGKVVVDGIRSVPAAGGTPIVPTLLAPGEELVARTGAPQVLAKVDVEQQLRWRDGFVEFEDVSLASAVYEMNRYSDRQIVITDPEALRLRVSGVFRTGDPERFAAIMGELLPLRSNPLPDTSIALTMK